MNEKKRPGSKKTGAEQKSKMEGAKMIQNGGRSRKDRAEEMEHEKRVRVSKQ